MIMDIEEHKKIIIIHIRGEFYIDNIEKAEETWNKQIEKEPEVIAINCSSLESIDSSAIATLVKFLNIAMNKKMALQIKSC